MVLIISLAIGIAAAVTGGIILAARDMGGWRKMKIAAITNNRRHQKRKIYDG